ncbi:MAG: TRAP transporter small permease subunit [Caulobacterales bacterium]|uniref:TRAP transporter small permease subunit n=1 Tax=Glycocaulis sp. TaxID=1969725 RepID=UPI003F9F9332
MRAGDWLLLLVIAGTLGVVALDQLTGGSVEAWTATNLSPLGAETARILGYIGYGLAPIVALPLLGALWTFFADLPRLAVTVLSRIAALIDAINTAIGDAARWFALGLVLVTSLIVIQRYVFGISITKLQESVIYLHALLFLLSSAVTLIAGGHVRVDIIYSRLSERAKAWTDIAGVYLALLPMCWLILDTSRSYVGGAWRIMERSRESDGLPLVFLLKTAIPVFAVMMIAQGVSMAAKAVLTVNDKRQKELKSLRPGTEAQ